MFLKGYNFDFNYNFLNCDVYVSLKVVLIFVNTEDPEKTICCKFRKFSRGFYFRKTLHWRSFVKIKSSQNGHITLSFTY